VLVLKHDSGVDSYLAASAIVGAPGPRIRLNGSKGSLVIRDLDPQEPLLRSGKSPVQGRWVQSTNSKAEIHRGDLVEEFPSEPGNYATFYALVHDALVGNGQWPVSTSQALAVAQIIDQARAMTIR